MSSLSMGDMAQSFALTRSGATMKTNIQRLSNELVTGLANDTSQHLSGDFGALAAIKTSLSRLQGDRAVTSEAGLLTDAMQTALGHITDMSGDLGSALLANGNSGGGIAGMSALGTEAEQKFEAAVSALNARVGDRNLFAGVETATTPLPSGADLLDTLQAVVAASTSAADVQTALDDWFADPAGYAASYLGGAPLAGLPVAPGELARMDVTALDPVLRDALKGLALSALVGRDVFAGEPEKRADLLRRSGEALVSSQSGLAELTSRLGTAQAQISDAAQRNTAETSALNIALSDLLSIDSYEVASQLQETQTQLETLYALTSRMSRLNLVNFL